MKVDVEVNPKHESYQISSFLTWLVSTGHHTTLTYTEKDLIDPKGKPELDNLREAQYYKTLVDRVLYDDGTQRVEVYSKPVNTTGTVRKRAE